MVLLWLCNCILEVHSWPALTHICLKTLCTSNKSVPYVRFHPITQITHIFYLYWDSGSSFSLHHVWSPGKTNKANHTQSAMLTLSCHSDTAAQSTWYDTDQVLPRYEQDNWNRCDGRRMTPPKGRSANVRVKLSLACGSSIGQTQWGTSFKGFRPWIGMQLKYR